MTTSFTMSTNLHPKPPSSSPAFIEEVTKIVEQFGVYPAMVEREPMPTAQWKIIKTRPMIKITGGT